MITSTSLLRKRTSGTARPVLSVESGDGRQILQQEKKLSQRSTTIENADFVFKLCASIVFIFSIFYVGISFIGVGNSHYSHQILAYTAPFLILAAVVGVCAPILILLTSSKQLTPYERMKVNKNILKKLKRNKLGWERKERKEREEEEEESSSSESSSESSESSDSDSDSSSDDSDSSLSSAEEKEQ